MIRTSRSSDRVKVTFALPLHVASGRCSVVGDFNEWIPGSHELRKRANGTRSTSVTVPRGTRLRFRYLGEDGKWFNDPDVEHRDGGRDARGSDHARQDHERCPSHLAASWHSWVPLPPRAAHRARRSG